MEIIKTLAEAIGVSGDEGEVRKLIMDAIEGHVDEMRVDTIGNLLSVKHGTGQSHLKGLVVAHMDEVGFMVSGHDSNGLLIVENVGGIDAKILPSLRVVVGDKKIPGVFVWTPIHKNRSRNIVSLDKMRIDVGVSSKDSAKELAPYGTRITFESQFVQLGASTVRCKALDDRVGCAELVRLCQGDPLPFELHAVFSVQEEVGLRGASVLARAVEPDFAIILESTACHETPQDPDLPDGTTVTKLGHGPAITYMDRRSIAHPGLLKHFVETAEANNIPHQFRSPQYAGGTDAGAIHVGGRGIPAISISVPGRYLHSPNTIISLDDYENTIKLVRHALESITPTALER